jgi:hypothetical protein
MWYDEVNFVDDDDVLVVVLWVMHVVVIMFDGDDDDDHDYDDHDDDNHDEFVVVSRENEPRHHPTNVVPFSILPTVHLSTELRPNE